MFEHLCDDRAGSESTSSKCHVGQLDAQSESCDQQHQGHELEDAVYPWSVSGLHNYGAEREEHGDNGAHDDTVAHLVALNLRKGVRERGARASDNSISARR